MRENKLFRWKLIISGALTGLINGFFGAGGGMVLIPLLTKLCKLEDKKAFASSVCIILPICVASLMVYGLGGHLFLKDSWPFLLGGAAGGVLGGLFFKKVSPAFLHRILGGFILWGGLRMILS